MGYERFVWANGGGVDVNNMTFRALARRKPPHFNACGKAIFGFIRPPVVYVLST